MGYERLSRPEKNRSDECSNENDGDNILNGEVDWVYEEELGVRSNCFWSPDGKRLAFVSNTGAP